MSPTTEIQLPQFGMGMGSGKVVQWLKQVGDEVAAGEPVVEVEAEKATVEVVSPADGVLLDIQVPAGETVAVRAVLGIVGEPGARLAPTPAAQVDRGNGASPATQSRRGALKGRPPVVPRARRMAKDHGIDAEALAGSGSDGRVTEEDVARAVDGLSLPGGSAARGEDRSDAARRDQVVPLSPMRRVIAERMHASLRDSAQLTLGYEADAEALVALRQRLAGAWPKEGRPSYLDMVVAAAARALRRHPRLNATLVGDVLTEHGSVNVGVAVAVDDGLVVPVIHDADRITLRELVRLRRDLVTAARQGGLAADALAGATFTVTSLGAAGVGFFTPILDPPQVAILGVGAIADGVRWEGDAPVRRRRIPLSLTVDHRAVDGAPAADLLADIAGVLANPLGP